MALLKILNDQPGNRMKLPIQCFQPQQYMKNNVGVRFVFVLLYLCINIVFIV